MNEVNNDSLHNVSRCGLTNEEVKERDMLLRLQSDHIRWFTKEEFDSLKELSNKMFKNRNMINIKLHKNEVQLIKESIESSKWFGNDPKLCDRVLKKLDKALTIPVVVGQSEQLVYKGKCDHGYKDEEGNELFCSIKTAN